LTIKSAQHTPRPQLSAISSRPGFRLLA
jgi:hypothetical protein